MFFQCFCNLTNQTDINLMIQKGIYFEDFPRCHSAVSANPFFHKFHIDLISLSCLIS